MLILKSVKIVKRLQYCISRHNKGGKMKQPVVHKKYHIVLTLLLVAILVVGSIYTVICTVAKSKYWAASYLQDAVLDLGEYEAIITETDAALDDVEAIVHECNEKAVPLSNECAAFIEACNEAIISCFQDVYEVDVREKLDTLQVMKAAYPENISQMVGGSYSSDFSEKLFMNAAILDSFISDIENGEVPQITSTVFSAKMLRTIYIHEAIHYLGFHSDSIFEHFTEAITESLNKEVMLHSGIKYEGITGYAAIQGFGAQIIACDAELVRKVVTDSGFHMGTYFNERLGGNYAAYYDQLIGLIQQEEIQNRNEIAYYTQFLTYEYCKAVNDDAKDILKPAKENTVNLFELKWFLKVY